MKRALPVLLLASLCVSTALATTYVRVEKDGTKTYSDRPIPGGEAIDVQPAQSYSAPPTSGNSSPSRRPDEVDDFRYQRCSVSPENDSTFTNPEAVPISLVTSPGLRSFDTVTMTVDGQAVVPAGSSSFTLTPVNRGTHIVAVTIKGRDGRVLCTVTSAFHVLRPGVNSPANRPRATPH